jgi:hypothetical protein
MPQLDLSDDEAAVLTNELLDLAKLSAESVGKGQPPLKVYARPKATAARRRRAGSI